MKVFREISSLTENDVCLIEHQAVAEVNLHPHFHSFFELCLVENVRGDRHVGDHHEMVEGGDLILVAPELSHGWQVDNESIPNGSRMITVQFDGNLFSEGMWKRNAFFTIQRLLTEAKRGLTFGRTTYIEVRQRLLLLNHMEGFAAVTAFLEILYTLSVAEERRMLASTGFVTSAAPTKSRRMDAIYQYILDNFTGEINRKDAAAIANLSESAFTHYFRKGAGKSFTRYIIDLRIGYACKLLSETQDTVKEVCYQSGFKNVSNFNKLFKKHKECTPVQYRLAFSQ